MPDRDDATNLLLALRDVGVADLSHERLENRVRSALADEIAKTTRTPPRRIRLRRATGRLFIALSVAIPIAIAVVAIALLSHKPGTAARSNGRVVTVTQQRRNNQLVRSLRLNRYEPVRANVIARNPVLWYTSVEIDEGSQDGVALNDPVIGDGVLVGKISRVDPTVAIVRLITDPSFSVAATLENAAGDTGMLEPVLGDPHELQLRELPNHARVAPGQFVVTAGLTHSSATSLYPAGIPVGQISGAKPVGKLGHGAVPVAPAADIRRLDAVQILTRPRSVPSALQQAFRVFGRARASADDLPSGYIRPALRNGADPSLSRFLIAAPAFEGGTPAKIWLIPARGQLCAVVKQGSGGGISCIPDSTAVQRGLIQGTIGRNQALMFGALPQGTQDAKMVQANGDSHPIRPTPTGGFVVRTRLPATLSFTQPDGRPVTVPLQPAPGPR